MSFWGLNPVRGPLSLQDRPWDILEVGLFPKMFNKLVPIILLNIHRCCYSVFFLPKQFTSFVVLIGVVIHNFDAKTVKY